MLTRKRSYHLGPTGLIRLIIDMERWRKLTEGNFKFKVATAEDLSQDLLEKLEKKVRIPFTDLMGFCLFPTKQDDPFCIILFLSNIEGKAIKAGISLQEGIVNVIAHETKHMQLFRWEPKQGLVSRFWKYLQLSIPLWGTLIELRKAKKETKEELAAEKFGDQKAKDPEWLKIIEIEAA